MFDFSKLGDMSKLAKDAKKLQAKQEIFHKKQLELLERICSQLEEIKEIIKAKKSM